MQVPKSVWDFARMKKIALEVLDTVSITKFISHFNVFAMSVI